MQPTLLAASMWTILPRYPVLHYCPSIKVLIQSQMKNPARRLKLHNSAQLSSAFLYRLPRRSPTWGKPEGPTAV